MHQKKVQQQGPHRWQMGGAGDGPCCTWQVAATSETALSGLPHTGTNEMPESL